MSYKLKDIFLESDSKTSETVPEEGLLSDIYGTLKDLASGALRGFITRNEIAQIDKIIAILQKMQGYGIKNIRGVPVVSIIKDLEREKRLLTGKDVGKKKNTLRGTSGLLKRLSSKAEKTTTPQRKKRTMYVSTESKYSLREIFGPELSTSKEEPVQNNDNPEYNKPSDIEKTALETDKPVEKREILSDEEILTGLRDDVAAYGEYDPVLGDSDE